MPKRTIYLREWRKHRALTQEQLADRLDTSVPTISRWENGKMNWMGDALPAFAEALGCDIADLFRDPLKPEYKLWRIISGMRPDAQSRALKVLEALGEDVEQKKTNRVA